MSKTTISSRYGGSSVEFGMASFNCLVDRISTPNKGEMITPMERKMRLGELGITIATHERDENTIGKLSIGVTELHSDRAVCRDLDLLDVASWGFSMVQPLVPLMATSEATRCA